MRLLLAVLLAAAVSCAADSEPHECAPVPAVALLVRTELDGTCGPMSSILTRTDQPVPAGCELKHEADEPGCFRRNRLTCTSGTIREWWLDGSSGRWVGEEHMTLASGCASTYRLELFPR